MQTAKSSDGTFQRSSIGGLASWGSWEKIIEAGELISQINIQSGNILIQTGKLYLDTTSTHMTTAYVNDLKAKSLEAVYADIVTLKTKVLTADVITSTMIKADAGLFDKVFINDTVVNKLTAKTSFISSVKAIDISADKVTTGTLNAANVAIINLNANNIATGTITGARSNWNLNTGKFSTSGTNGDLIELENGVLRSYSANKNAAMLLNSGALRLQNNVGTNGEWVQISPYGTSYSNAAYQDVSLFRTNIGLGLRPGAANTYSKNVVFCLYGVNPMIAFDVTDSNLNSLRNMTIQASDYSLVATVSDRFRIDSNTGGVGKGVFEAGAFYSNSGVNLSRLKIEGDEITNVGTNELFIVPGSGGQVVLGNKTRSARYDLELNYGCFYGGGNIMRISGNQIGAVSNNTSLFLTPSGSGQSVYASNPEKTVYYGIGASGFYTLSERRFKSDIVAYAGGSI